MSRLIAVVFGTRPEAVKLLPLVHELRAQGHQVLVCATYQHTHLLEQMFSIFSIKPDVSLGLMQENQSLEYITAVVMQKVSTVLAEHKPGCVVVVGDTASAFSASLAAFYQKIPVVHVEAGLRSQNQMEPFPEELLRCLITRCASWHCAPTWWNVATLQREGVDPTRIALTGNTVVDALYAMRQKFVQGSLQPDAALVQRLATIQNNNGQLVLMTAHRRESFGQGLINIFQAAAQFAMQYPDTHILFPVHPNPAVRSALQVSGLQRQANVSIISPLSYDQLIYVLEHVDWVLTDSGGIQEEAVTLGKPLVVARKVTERPELVWQQRGILAGTEKTVLYEAMCAVAQGALRVDPSTLYGDGKACGRVAEVIQAALKHGELHAEGLLPVVSSGVTTVQANRSTQTGESVR